MPKEYFAVERARSLAALSPGAHIHIIAVSGVAMAQLAVELSKAGYIVSGSDEEFYDPMGSLLRNSSVKICKGYSAENIPANVDLVVIGNKVSYGNPEVDLVEREQLPYTLFPKILHELIISGRHSVVVAGTHGKSTTTAMIATVLTKLGQDPSYFIGGIAIDLPNSLYRGAGRMSVVEGDEYDSAFFAKVPKFRFYAPDTAVINAIEFDHADIYPNIESIALEFKNLLSSVPQNGAAVCCVDFEQVRKLIEADLSDVKCRIITFGEATDSQYRIEKREASKDSQQVTVKTPLGKRFVLNISLSGAYNARNAVAAYIVSELLGIESNKTIEALSKFQPVKRRQEFRGEISGVTVIEDFAHHPTAARETLKGISEAYSNRRIIAVFEPRSNTSRKKVFHGEYIKAFSSSDLVVLSKVAMRGKDIAEDLLDVGVLADDISRSGVKAVALGGAGEIVQYLVKNCKAGDIVVVMSNGSFDGLIDKLLLDLKGEKNNDGPS